MMHLREATMFDNPSVHSRPTLILLTVPFHAEDHEPAHQLGLDLFENLTRSLTDPLAFGAGIPVFCGVDPDEVDLQAAETVVVIPVLGKLAFMMNREATIARLNEWHAKLGEGHVLPVILTENWLNAEGNLPGLLLRTELFGNEPRRRETIIEIVLAVSRLLVKDQDETSLFVSHAKLDLKPTQDAGQKIAGYAKTSLTAKAFFDRTELFSGESLNEQIDFAASRGVFVAVRGDSYSSRAWCQHELLQAKKHGLPTLTVEVLRKGERRSMAYGGNGPTIVWDVNKPDPGEVVLQAMVEWLRARLFLREGSRIREAAGLPETEILVRPPELLDMAQGPLRSGEPQLVMHPDPELSVQERQLLRAANPRMRLVTPLTAFRRVLSRHSSLAGDAPLEGLQVAMSLSDSPDVNGKQGYTKHHIVDVTVQLARALISAGAAIAYGGDFRNPDMMDSKRQGYTLLLAELIGAYNQTAAKRSEFLHSYLGAPIPSGDVPDNVPMTLHHMEQTPYMAKIAILPPSSEETHPSALYFSDMRQAMVKRTHARIAIGGNGEPRLKENGDGYGGRYPGVVEEAWRSLEAQQPLYVVGGFGGAAAMVAELLEDRPVPKRLKDATWLAHDFFREKAIAIDDDPFRMQLALPQTMDDLAEAVKTVGLPLLSSDEAAISWNGLTVAENRTLFWSRDTVLITSLVMKGLLKVTREKAAGKLAIELVQGSVTAAIDLDAIAVGAFEGVPLGGAGAALDEVLGGRASMGRTEGRQMISVSHSDVNADWLYLASLGQLSDADRLEEQISRAAQQTAVMAQRHGLRRVGVVAYGGTVCGDLPAVAKSMLTGLSDLAGFASIVWFESDDDRFNLLRKVLGADERVKLTTRRVATANAAERTQKQPLILQVRYEDGNLTVTVLPPTGNAVVSIRRQVFSKSDIDRLAAGSGSQRRNTPDLQTISARGQELTKSLLGGDADRLLAQVAEANVIVVHDVPSSRFPFETLRGSTSGTPATQAGMSRRLAVPGVPVEHLYARPPKAERLNVLLVINPTSDLAGAEEEGKVVEAVLEQQPNVNLTVLRRDEATKAAMLDAFVGTDVLHYCGHAFYDGPGEYESGLLLAGRDPLTLADLRGVETPRVAFLNACEAGRVRGDTMTTEAASFAEFFLRSGIEAYLGTFWTVGDAAAKTFAGELYAHLATGQTLDEAVTRGRRKLQTANLSDWANYILYGDGRFRMVREPKSNI